MQYTLSRLIVGFIKLILPKTEFKKYKFKQLAKQKNLYKIGIVNFFHSYYLNKKNIFDLNSLFKKDINFDIPIKFKRHLQSEASKLKFNLGSVYPSDIILLWYLIKKYKVNNFVETGTGYGYSTVLIYEGLKAFNKKKIILQTFGLPTQRQLRYSSTLFKKYPYIKKYIGKVPDIFEKKKINQR